MCLVQKVVLSFNGYWGGNSQSNLWLIREGYLSWVAWESNWEPVSNQVMGFLSLVQSTHDSSWDLHFVSVIL